AEVVHRMYEAAGEEVEPHPVGERAGEVRVVLRRQPLDEGGACGGLAGGERLAVEEGGRDAAPRVPERRLRDGDRGAARPVGDAVEVAGRGAEERRDAPVLLLRPRAVRVVVTLGALELDPHEEGGRGAGGAFGRDLAALPHDPEVDDLRLRLDVPLDG